MASWQYRFYSTLPRRVFDHVASSWPSAMVRRHAWKVGGSGIWYVTIALDEAEAAEQFDAWLDGNSRRMNISKLMGGGGNYEAVLLHPKLSIVKQLLLRLAAFRRRSG